MADLYPVQLPAAGSLTNADILVVQQAGTPTVVEQSTIEKVLEVGYSVTTKTTPIAADTFSFFDSISNQLRKLTWTNLLSALGTTFAALAGSASQTFSVGTPASSTDAVQLQQVSLFPTVASATAPDIFAAAGATINYTGTTTATSFAACTAAQVGSTKRIIPVTGSSFTASANLIIDGATSGTILQPAGALVEVLALSTTQFKMTTIEAYGTWTPNQGAGLTVVGAFSSAGTYTKVGRLVTLIFYVSGATSIAVAAGAVVSSNSPFAASNPGGSGSGTNGNNTQSLTATQSASSIYANSAVTATPSITLTLTITA
jgi:hypothetical protein